MRRRSKKLIINELDQLEYLIRLTLKRYEDLRGILAVHKFLTKLINQRYNEVSKNLATNKKTAGEVLIKNRGAER